jgi:hypothetical protein
MAAIVRKNARPAPGQPSGNVENRRCTRCPALRLLYSERNRNPKKQIEGTPLSRGLEVDNSAFQADGDGVRPVVGAQFGENIFDVALDGFFGDGELRTNFLVGISA